MRIGLGYDSHRFQTGKPLVLGGVTIPHPQGLAAHSDGDALAHALIDALLGAAGEPNIGELFPDTDPEWKGADSMGLVKKVMERVGARFVLVNADCIVICEAPKIGPHLPAMRQSLAAALLTETDRLSIKGKTNEKMGWIGRGEGIAVQVVVLLEERGR